MKWLKNKRLWIFVAIFALLIGASNVYFRVLRPDPDFTAATRADGDTYPVSLATAKPDSKIDPWGMDNRECVSYVAWKVNQTYHDMPNWYGVGADAKNWPKLAQSSGFNVGTTPKVGSVAIQQPTGAKTSNSSQQNSGHAMWVEQVNSNGTILVSEYNGTKAWGFSYSTVSSTGLQYIYFGQKS